jgi:hypothetical protein
MRTWTFERLGALAGIAFILLSLIGDFSSGTPPGTDDSAAKIADFFQDHHQGVIASVVLTGIAGPFFVWFLAAVVLRLRAVGETAWAVAVFGLALAALGAGVAADAFYGSLARIGTYGDDRLAKSVYQLDGFFTVKSFWFAAGTVLAVGIAAWRRLPQWYAMLSIAAAVVCALSGIAVRKTGFLTPLGGLTDLAFLALLVWIVASAVMLWREPVSPEARGAV